MEPHVTDWLIGIWVHLGLKNGPFVPQNLILVQGSPVPLLKFQMAPSLQLLMSSGSKTKEPTYTCLSEAKATHSQRMWAEVSSSAPHLLHKGLLFSPIKWRSLLRVLCPVGRPTTTLDCVLLKDMEPHLQNTVSKCQICIKSDSVYSSFEYKYFRNEFLVICPDEVRQ
jgi:hypothetical protein